MIAIERKAPASHTVGREFSRFLGGTWNGVGVLNKSKIHMLESSDKESDDSKEDRWGRRQFSIGKQECFICEKLSGSDDKEIVRRPSTSVQINDGDEHAVTVDENASAFGHNKIRKCSFPSCTLRFHENCFLIFTEGDFLPRIHIFDRHGDLCINLKDSKKWICPQHECNFCHQELLRTRAFQGKFIRCVKCVFAWHRSCVIVGSLHMDRKRDRYVLCPRHSTVKRASKRNISYCIKCENSFENESQKVACDSCIRSFCHSCVDKNKIKETETDHNSYVCDFCRCFDFPRIGDYVLATYKSRFWPARALHADLLPLSLYSVNNLIEKLREPGYVLVEWIEGLSVPNYDVVTCRDLVSFPKTLKCPFWSRMKTHANIYKAAEAVYASSKVTFGIKRPLPREVKAEMLPKYTRIKTNINMRLARARSNTVEFGHCNCEPIDGKRCTIAHNCLNRILMTECPEDCDATYFERRNALAGGTKRQVLKRTAGLSGNKNFFSPSQQMCTNNFLRYHDTNDDKLFMEEKPTKLKGFGAFAKCDIDKGTDLTEYIGQVMTKEEYLEKLRFRSLFSDLEASYFGMRLTNDFYVDARNYGSVARSFNHSCEPNTKVDAVTVDGIYRLKISTIKNIRKGEELTFDYDTEITEGLVGMECFCGSTSCRRIIGKKANTTRKIANVKACFVLNEQTNNNNGEDTQSRIVGSKDFSEVYENSNHSGRKHTRRKRKKYAEENKSTNKDFFGRITQNEENIKNEAEKHLDLEKDFLASRATNISVKNARRRSREQLIVLEHKFLKNYATKQLKKGKDYQFISDDKILLVDTAQIAKGTEMERTRSVCG
ncbi:Nuclear receptor binding SET domain protein [Dirofilaria immitis]